MGFLCPLGLGWMGRGPPQTKRLIIDQIVTYTSHVRCCMGTYRLGVGSSTSPGATRRHPLTHRRVLRACCLAQRHS